MDILQRITELMKCRNWSLYKLSKLSDIPYTTLANMYKRNNAPTFGTLELICSTLNVSLSEFFATGDQLVSLSDEQHELLDEWSTLTDSQKKNVLGVIRDLRRD